MDSIRRATFCLLALFTAGIALGVRAQLPAWQAVSTPAPVSDEFTVGADDPSVVFAVSPSSSSSPADSSLAYLLLGGLLADPRDAGRVYNVAKDGSIFESRDRGSSWKQAVQQLGALYYAAVGAGSTERVFYGESATGLVRIALPDGTQGLGSDLWWNPAESGMGFTITHTRTARSSSSGTATMRKASRSGT